MAAIFTSIASGIWSDTTPCSRLGVVAAMDVLLILRSTQIQTPSPGTESSAQRRNPPSGPGSPPSGWNPPPAMPSEGDGVNSGRSGFIGGCPTPSMRPTGAGGTYIEPGSGSIGCSGAGARSGPSCQGSSKLGSIDDSWLSDE